jgi:hypothetical protein
MIYQPLPGTRVKTGPNPMGVEPPPPVKHGQALSFMGAAVHVRWEDGTQAWMLGQYLDPDESE